MKNFLELGQWNSICDVCGYKIKSDQLRKRWDGLMVCEYDWETRHIQDLIRISAEKVMVPWARPESTDTFLGTSCTVFTSQGVADRGTADCARADLNFNTGTFNEWSNYILEDENNAIAGSAVAGLAVSGTGFSLSPSS